MTQQRLTESPEKTQQHVESRETSPAFAQLFHGRLHPIAQLQRRLGNRRVAQLIQAKRLTPEGKIIGLQRKLTVGAADDQYEQEADRVARHVLNTSDAVAANSIQRAMSPEEDKDQTLQTKPLAASITPFVQRQMGNNEESEDNEKSVQAKFFTETSRDPLQRQPETEEEETEPIQAKSARPLADSFEAGAEVETQVSLSKGRGSPLPNPVRAYMEPRFGADFSQVRVHTGSDALQMNHAVGAQAFTHGSDIYFGAGKSPTDLSLTAHELTHVVQQGRAGPLQTSRLEASSVANTDPPVQRGRAVPGIGRTEEEEEKVAPKGEPGTALQDEERGKPVQAKLATDTALQRQPKQDDEKGEEPLQAPPPVQRQMAEEDEEAIQTKPLPGGAIQRLCTECEGEKQQEHEKPAEMVQRRSARYQLHDDQKEEKQQVLAKGGDSATPSVTPSVAANSHSMNHGGREKGPLNFLSTATPGGLGLTSAPPIVHEVLSSPGQPLGTTERAFMEPRFGQDFSGVRVHTGAKAAESAAAVQARAYTVGNNIVYGGKESASDLPVLAHELTHVVQQSGASSALQRLEYCADFLEVTRRPGVGEHSVSDNLRDDAAIFGPVARELSIPAASFAPWRTEPSSGDDDSEIPPQKIDTIKRTKGEGPRQGDGKADVGLLSDSTLEVIEVKEATWRKGWEAEEQLANYLSKAKDMPDLVTENWRNKTNSTDEIKSVKAMPMTRLRMWPNPRAIGGELVRLRWCRDGIIVFKVEPPEEEEQKDKKPKDKKPRDKKPGPSDTLPEKLLKLGGALVPALAAAGLLNTASAIASVMGALVTSPLLALAALVLGIVYFWDKLEWLGSKIAGLVQLVREKYTWILGKLQSLGIELDELVSWLKGKIAWLAEKLAEGAKWAAGKVKAGAKWVGHKIASAAEAVWDWLFGTGPEPIVPVVIDLRVTEETRHCATVAHEDTFVKIGTDHLFPFNEWKLIPEADGPLKKAAEKIGPMLQKDDRIIIEGYTDNIGSDKYNQHLSEQRAGAVASWFVGYLVVPMSRIQIQGYGKTRAQYNDPDGRKKDRRVEIWIPKKGSVKEVCW